MRIGVILLGAAGYMGGAGLLALAQVRKRYEHENVQIDLIAVVDPAIQQDHTKERLTKSLAELDYPDPQTHLELMHPELQPALIAASEYLAKIHTGHTDGTKLFVYDASPT